MSRRPRRQAGKGPRGASRAREELPEPPEALRRLGLSPRKALGQHFLVDELLLGDIADACLLDAESTVLEIGAGPGGLTEELAARAGRVVAVELDEELAALARRRLEDRAEVCVVAADILDFEPDELLAECGVVPTSYVAAGNLPYYITQPVVRRLLEAECGPSRIVVLVQREVARRIVGWGGRESLLSMSVRVYGEPELVLDVPATAFWPEPKVQSSVVRIERHPRLAVDLRGADLERFFRVLRAGFSEPRKQLRNTLRRALGLPEGTAVQLFEDAAVDPALRAQHLGLAEWERLYRAIEERAPRSLDLG